MNDRAPRRRFSLTPGNGGWVQTRSSDLDVAVMIRFAETGDGGLTIADVYLPYDGLEPTKKVMDQVAELIELTAFWVRGEDREQVLERLPNPGPDLRTAAEHFTTTFYDEAPDHWAKQMLHSQLPEWNGPRPAKVRGTIGDRLDWRTVSGDLLIEVPTGRPYPDAFYQRVADAYAVAFSGGSHRPAADIADVNDLPVRTVQRWVACARRRKFLPEGRPGKAG